VGIGATLEQVGTLAAIKSFLLDETLDAFIPPGSAGTDKMTLIVGLVDQLQGMNLSSALLAPTGRATCILRNTIRQITGESVRSVSTIHKALCASHWIDINVDAKPPVSRRPLPVSAQG
jgi:hypothetical protein